MFPCNVIHFWQGLKTGLQVQSWAEPKPSHDKIILMTFQAVLCDMDIAIITHTITHCPTLCYAVWTRVNPWHYSHLTFQSVGPLRRLAPALLLCPPQLSRHLAVPQQLPPSRPSVSLPLGPTSQDAPRTAQSRLKSRHLSGINTRGVDSYCKCHYSWLNLEADMSE